MTKPTLVIGNKNLSSWSLRPWLAMKMAGVDFEEKQIALDRPETKDNIKAFAPFASGKVPLLLFGDVVVWESLAICEVVAETWAPQLWPRDATARAHARAISHEMHAGFSALRSSCPMNLKEDRSGNTLSPTASYDVKRIGDLWKYTRDRFGKGGKFLFGADFTIADAMYAPVVTRFTTYGIYVDDNARDYIQTIWALPAMQEWKAAALKEP
jgi:glutathione S-transferase